jgi:ATP-dependent 26S proteasome regulatory subunit
LGTDSELPARLEKVLTVIDYDLPTEDELTEVAVADLESRFDEWTPAELLSQARAAARATVGLTVVESKLAVAMSIACKGTVDPALMLTEKKAIIRKSGLLEYYEGTQDLTEVGGLSNLKKWLKDRGGAFSEEAKKYGLPPPKALMLVGTPGTGKSLVAKTIGKSWNMPVLRLDVGSMFGSLVGESEGRMRRALKVAESVAPAVLFIN